METQLLGLDKYAGGLNLPGLRLVEYIPTVWVDNAQYEACFSPEHTITEVPLVAGRGWLRASLLPTGKIWREVQQDSPQGESFTQTVRGRYPGNTKAARAELMRMARRRFLLRLTDRDGHSFIAGSLERPFQFASTLESGVLAGDLRHHLLVWTAISPFKAAFVDD